MKISFYQLHTIRGKVHIFREGHKILQNLHQLFDWQYIGQIIGGDFANLHGLLRIYELKLLIAFHTWHTLICTTYVLYMLCVLHM